MDQIVNLAMFTMDRTVTQSGTQRTPCDSQRRDARDTTACRPTSRRRRHDSPSSLPQHTGRECPPSTMTRLSRSSSRNRLYTVLQVLQSWANCSHLSCLCSPSGETGRSPLKGCEGNCGPGGRQPTSRFMTYVTCRLTDKKRDQLRNPTLSNRVWATFMFTFFRDYPGKTVPER